MKFTKNLLHRLEDLFAETDYMLRYEKGNFRSGYCVLKDTRLAIINKFHTTEGKIAAIIEILRQIEVEEGKLSEENRSLLQQIRQHGQTES